MPSGSWPRGSEWRKWDLHVHTPFSALNNGFGNDFEAYAKAFFERAVEKQVAVVGVTDYFSIRGYKELRRLREQPSRLEALVGAVIAKEAQRVALIPNIELRASVVVVSPDGGSSRVNYHVLFSDEIDATAIEEHFLRELKFTAASNPGNPDETWSVTDANLEALGHRLKQEQPSFQGKSDLFIGMINACVPHEEVSKVLERQRSRFKDRFLLVVAADGDLSKCSWDGQAHLTRKLFIQKSHMLFSGNPGTRDFALGKKHPTPTDFEREFGSRKAAIHGSDAHSYDTLFEPAGNRHLWIKAAPTFQGLRQLLYEPESRVYIGESPPFFSRVDRNATKYISSVTFERTDVGRSDEVWFSGTVPLSHGLVAIIGNKGSGKSALADILALVADARCADYFSFLTKDKFLTPKAKLGQMFQASVRWHSGREVPRLLGAIVGTTQPELVKCLPQNYLEKICSEVRESSENAFDRELMEVIFSHVSDDRRLGKATLPDLIDHVTKEKEARIGQLAEEVSGVNAAIASLESELTEEHRMALEGQLTLRRLELQAHDAVKPQGVREPNKDPEQNDAAKAVKVELSQLVEKVHGLDLLIAGAHEQLRVAALQIAAADRLLTRIENLERRLETFHSESVEDSQLLGVDTSALVTLPVDRQPILNAKANSTARSDASRSALDSSDPGSPVSHRAVASADLDAIRAKLDEPDRRYQEYLHTVSGWTLKRSEIEGAATIAESLKGLEARVAALAEIPNRIAVLKAERLTHVREIFRAKEELLAEYRGLYSSVQEFIDRHPVSQQQDALKFSAAIAVDGLTDGLLDLVHQGRKGSFQGEQEGRERLREIVARHDFCTESGVEAFLGDVQDQLEHDRREATNRPLRLQNQLRQGITPEQVYDFLYALSYLRPHFELRWRDKTLDQLSPGERGNLLLVFYLLIDKRDVPLIIDQPEENLDNETIVTMLVPAFKYAKERRQIFIVTHNPNLAVVCDAEQIIHAQLDKTDGNRVTYTSGGIEDPAITKLIVDVLEGTKPAFDLRDAKYEILERLS